MAAACANVRRDWTTDRVIDLGAQIGSLRRGRGDPSWAVTTDGSNWRTSRTPMGPGTQRIRVDRRAGSVEFEAWGPGAAWLCEHGPALLGADDGIAGFEPPQALQGTWQRHCGLRVPKSGRVLESLVPAILGQRITGKEAKAAWRLLVSKYGTEAPMSPPGTRLVVFPSPEVWRRIPSWEWHAAGVDSARSRVVMNVLGTDVEKLNRVPAAEASKRLRMIPGVGLWTAAETAQRALGDADAVSYGDYHLSAQVVHALTGDRGGTDKDMEVLLRPYAGHRFRVQQLVELSVHRMPRHGPRITIQDHRRL